MATEEDFPEFAATIGVDGRVVLDCLASIDGRVRDCQIVSARPESLGFEQAALEIALRGVIEPAHGVRGEPVLSRFRFRIPFSLDDEPFVSGPRPPRPNVAQATPSSLALAKQLVERYGVTSAFPLEMGGLPLERRAVINRWIDRGEIDGSAELKDAAVQMTAAMFSDRQMRTLLAGGQLDSMPVVTEEILSLGDYILWDVDIGSLLRKAYCRQYDCG
ncbi:energy transducer TonB [Brevundimonas sp. VNH65]|uniref:energy transducer TonB n=1 Tax=Brevundimonas sp. VNH65 TaxID=3400917 RepID=UPI003C056C2D